MVLWRESRRSYLLDWNAYQQLFKLLENSRDKDLRKMLDEGQQVLNKKLDDLEKPLREKGIIDRKTKNTSTKKGDSVREYTKSGGKEALQKDFEKFEDSAQVSSDGQSEYKELKKGGTVVKRPAGKENKTPTLEVQPRKSGHSGEDRIRIKVRYE